jgi:hypothetical protein
MKRDLYFGFMPGVLFGRIADRSHHLSVRGTLLFRRGASVVLPERLMDVRVAGDDDEILRAQPVSASEYPRLVGQAMGKTGGRQYI